MNIPEWFQEQVIILQDVDDDLDEETVKRKLNCFGIVEKVQFIVSNSRKRHAFVTFKNAESAARALNGTSKLPIKPTNSSWFSRYEPPARYLPQRRKRPGHLPTRPSENPHILMATRMTTSGQDNRTEQREPDSTVVEPSDEGTTATSSAHIESIRRQLEGANRLVMQLQAALSHVKERFQLSEEAYAKDIQTLQSVNNSLSRDLIEAHKSAAFSEERLARMLSEERERNSHAEVTLQNRVKYQDSLIAELRNELSNRPRRDNLTSEMQIAPANFDNEVSMEDGEVSSHQLEDGEVPQFPIHNPILKSHISAVGPPLLEAFRLLDQIVSGALSKEALTTGPDEPTRKKRKLDNV